MTGWAFSAHVQDQMFRALAVLRVVVLLNAVGLYAYRYDAYARPALGWMVMAVLTVWTAWMGWTCRREAGRHAWVFAADLAVALAAIAMSPVVKGDGMRATLPGFWVSAVLLGWAIRYRSRGGLAAAIALSTADLLVREQFTQTTYANIFLLVLGGQVVGFLSDRMQVMATERDEALLTSATATERQRIARVVHDGVLQVLAMVQRDGAALGPRGAALARLAGDEEARLRAFVQTQEHSGPQPGSADLVAVLAPLARAGVQVASPASPVPVPAETARQLQAAVQAALSNIRHHVGPEAPAWVLLEDLGGQVVISVRDKGPGIPEGRLDEAAAQGRLGVPESIRGRIRDLGGVAELTTSAAGTEWEFTVPKAVSP